MLVGLKTRCQVSKHPKVINKATFKQQEARTCSWIHQNTYIQIHVCVGIIASIAKRVPRCLLYNLLTFT